MPERIPDMLDFEDYEAEQERLSRMRKRLAYEYDLADGRMDEEHGLQN